MKKAFLIILDGWGLGNQDATNAVYEANTPFFDHLMNTLPNAKLKTHGPDVGLPEGQMGNSEVGHLNIGAGRIVYQDLLRINKAIEDDSFFQMEAFQDTLNYCKNDQKPLHIMGLVSDGGVHSHIDHLKGIIRYLGGVSNVPVYVHAFTDGRDTDPESGKGFIKEILQLISEYDHIQLASVVGRYYAMDRDNRWQRIKVAYDLLVQGEGEPTDDFHQSIQDRYNKGETDEFLLPMRSSVLGEEANIKKGDAVFFFNFRTDRPRQLTIALTQKAFPEHDMHPLELWFLTMTRYDESFEGIKVLFTKDNIQNTLGEVIARQGKSQLRIAETEKYPHVTYFFSGGREKVFDREQRIVINSPKVATYDLKPEMSAYEVSAAVEDFMRKEAPDFICLNYANADMVGHTGDFEATKKAIEAVDKCLKSNIELAKQKGYEILVIADHGNADMMKNADGSPNTAHTKNAVPVIFIGQDQAVKLQDGRLADVAPTLLQLMNIEPPEDMTGKSLLI